MPDNGQDSLKSPVHPATVNQDKHVDNLQKSVANKRTMSRLDSIENESAQVAQRMKASQMRSREGEMMYEKNKKKSK